MVDQVRIQRPLQPIRRFGIGVCASSESTVATTGGGILSLQMIGMDLLIVEVLHGFLDVPAEGLGTWDVSVPVCAFGCLCF